MHSIIKWMFVAISIVVVILTAGSIIMRKRDEWPYIEEKDENVAVTAFSTMLEYFVLISHTIPISIYVAIEVLKWFQVRLISKDRHLNNSLSRLKEEINHYLSSRQEIEDKKVKITNSDILENLGQIDLCICDKTGTLTDNMFKLRRFYTDG